MKILVSNPDNIGDVVLRQPMYAALSGAGHELMLAVRSFVSPITPLVAPKAQVLLIESDPYSSIFDSACADVRRAIEAAREFAPDVYCIAPYQRTEFDELLAESLTGCRTVGMAGMLFPGVIDAGLNRKSRIRLDREVPVSVDQHELEKSGLLCSELLGRTVKLPDPVIRAEKAHLNSARSVIGRLGLEPGRFWIACVGCNQWTAVKNWALENWAKVLSHVVSQHGQKLLMIGTPDESAATEQIRNLMGPAADATENICDSPQPLATAVGLLQLSAGYIGRDTGPMHLAAALGKPVVAVFGGGHWPRFTPRAKVGAVASVVMPCSGCDWACHLRESYCVKRVPVEAMMEAFDAVQNRTLKGVRIQQFQMDPMLSARIIRESSMSCRDLRRRLAAAELQQSPPPDVAQEAELAQLRAERNAEDEEFSRSKAAQETVLAQLRAELEASTRVASELRRSEAEQRAELAQLRAELEASTRAASELQRTRHTLADLSDQLADSRRELAIARASSERLAEQRAFLKAEHDHLQGQVHSERLKAQVARRDAEKVQKQALEEAQSIRDVLNDLVLEHTTLKQTVDREAREAREAAEAIRQRDHLIGDYEEEVRDLRATIKDIRESISFRLMVTAGRPIAALRRMLRPVGSHPEEAN